MDSIDENKENEISTIATYTLSIYDILENIISYLNLKSLHQASGVSR